MNKLHKALVFLLLSMAAFFSCNEPSEIGADLIDDEAAAQFQTLFTDTLQMNIKMVVPDSVKTQGGDIFLLGRMEQASFGTSKASIYGRLSLPLNDINLGTSPQIDSAVLILRYSTSQSIYGDSSAVQNLEVYTIEDDLYNEDSITYYANTAFQLSANAVGSLQNFYFNDEDSLLVEGDTVPEVPQLRIRLNNSFGQTLLDKAQGTDSIFYDNDKLHEYLKGLYISVDNSQSGAAIASFNLTNGTSRLKLYYTDTETGAQNDFSLYFYTPKCFNSYQQDYTETEIQTILEQNDGYTQGEWLYLQGMKNLRWQMKFPTIENLGKIIINDAILELQSPYVLAEMDTLFAPPNYLACVTSDQSSSAYQSAANNFLVSKSDTLYTYNVSLKRYLQDFVSDPDTSRVYNVLLQSNSSSPNILKIASPNNADYPLKLKLFYTKID
ncbi:MAG: DUF4270 family protein [Chitinophagales bacterium]|nr:DUF4270 family protein [Bacteroidota bacterium]MCB9043792.1 DUF4270 family protein [Chitinophagales bacterium]